MARKSKKKFHLGIGHIIRWIIFAVVIFYSIQYLSQKPNQNYNVSIPEGELSGFINSIQETVPPSWQTQFQEIIPKITGFVTNIPAAIDPLVTKIKKDIITQIYDQIIHSIEKK